MLLIQKWEAGTMSTDKTRKYLSRQKPSIKTKHMELW